MNIWSLLIRRSILKRKLRFIMTLTSVVFGVALVFGVLTTQDSAQRSFNDLIDELGGRADLQVTDSSSKEFKLGVVKEIEESEGVKIASGSIRRGILWQNEDKTIPLEFLAVDPKRDEEIRDYKIDSGRFIKTSDVNSVMLNSEFAKANSVGVGDTVDLVAADGLQPFKVVALLKSNGIGRVANGRIAITTLKAGQEIFSFKDSVNQVDIVLTDKGQLEKVKSGLEEKLDKRFEIDRPAEKGEIMSDTIDFMMSGFRVYSYFILIVSSLLILGAFRMSLQERTADVGALRAIGAKRRQIIVFFIGEAAVFAIIGVFFGIALGWLLASGLLMTMAEIMKMNSASLHFSTKIMGTATALGIISVFLGSLWPAIKGGSISPLTALKGIKRETPGQLTRFGALIGSIAIVLSLAGLRFLSENPLNYMIILLIAFIGALFCVPFLLEKLSSVLNSVTGLFGYEGQMAIRNVQRSSGRSGAAAIALVASASLILMIGAFSRSMDTVVDDYLPTIADFDLQIGEVPFSMLDTNKYPQMTEETLKEIKSLEGVKDAARRRYLPVKVDGKTYLGAFSNTDFEERAIRAMVGKDADRVIEAGKRGDHIIISERVAAIHDVGVGDKLPIETPKGRKEFTVNSVNQIIAFGGNAIYLSDKDLKKYWDDDGANVIAIKIDSNASFADVKKRVRETGIGKTGLQIMSGEELIKEIDGAMDQFMLTFRGMIFFAVIISMSGMLNILVMNVFERRREIGMLRAVGFTRRQIRKTFMLEAAVLGLFGGILGLVAGLPLSWLYYKSTEAEFSWGLKYQMPTEFLGIVIAVSLIVSVIAGLYPASKAAKTNIVTALRSE